MALNEAGVLAVVLNRRGSLGPAADKRSRGELVLEAVDHTDAVAAATALADLNPDAYRPFNLIVIDNRDGYWIAHRGPGPVTVTPLPAGLSLIAADDLNDPESPRDRFRAAFAGAARPDPDDRASWDVWAGLMARRDPDPQDGPLGGLTVVTDQDYATVSASLVGLPAVGRTGPDGRGLPAAWLVAAGQPGAAPFTSVPVP